MINLNEIVERVLNSEEQARLEEIFSKTTGAADMAPFLGALIGHLIRGGLTPEEALEFLTLNAKVSFATIEAVGARPL